MLAVTTFVFAAVAAIGLGAMGVVISLGQRRVVDAPAAAVVIVATAALITMLVALPGGLGSDAEPGTLAFLAVAGALAPGLGQGMFVHAVQLAGPSRATLVLNSSPVFAVAIAVALLGEELTVGVAVGTVLIVSGAMTLAWERTRPEGFRLAGLAVAGVSALLVGTQNNVLRHGLEASALPGTDAVALSLIAASVVAFAYLAVSSRGNRLGARLAAAAPAYLPAGVVFAISFEGLVGALDRGQVVVVAPLVATQTMWTVAFALIVLGQARERVGLRLVGAAALMVSGTALVGAYR